MKSMVEEIPQRFDADVERFSNLETGQSATVDSPLALVAGVTRAGSIVVVLQPEVGRGDLPSEIGRDGPGSIR
jgi:hypothetical protein